MKNKNQKTWEILKLENKLEKALNAKQKSLQTDYNPNTVPDLDKIILCNSAQNDKESILVVCATAYSLFGSMEGRLSTLIETRNNVEKIFKKNQKILFLAPYLRPWQDAIKRHRKQMEAGIKLLWACYGSALKSAERLVEEGNFDTKTADFWVLIVKYLSLGRVIKNISDNVCDNLEELLNQP